MRIVIDMQGAQTSGSRNRGIGRYSTALAQAIIRNRGEHEILLALNGAFTDTIEPIRQQFSELLPQQNIHVWNSLSPINHIDVANDPRRKASEYIRESFLASLKPDAVLISSHFEGSGDDAVTSIGRLPTDVLTAVILYDLIPLINRNIYLSHPLVERWYEGRIADIKRADLLLAISESSRQEGIHYLGFSSERSINVGTAADDQFRKIKLSSQAVQSLRQRYGLVKPFVMYTGGIDHRKNIEGLIRAFAKLPREVRKSHQLAVVCSLREHDRPRLMELAEEHGLSDGEIVMTGFVPEDDLIALYNTCHLFVFPSWHEGFGLPALEAMWCGAPVVAANSSSLPEVIGLDDALFDPFDDADITRSILQGLTDNEYRNKLIDHGAQQCRTFSWDKSAKLAIKAFEQIWSEGASGSIPNLRQTKRPKMAYVSPVPPAKSGIADYSADLLPELQRHYDITVIMKDGVTDCSDPFIKSNFRCISTSEFISKSSSFDRVIYQVGNSDHHEHLLDLIVKIPGIAVQHDFFLSDLSAWAEHINQKPEHWSRDIYFSHGYSALRRRHRSKNLEDVISRYPCNLQVVANALGIICHSQAAKELQVEWYGQNAASNWHVIPLLRTRRRVNNRHTIREALGLRPDDFLVCSFGIMGKTKLNCELLDAWLNSPLAKDNRCKLVFVGEHAVGQYGEEIEAAIDKSGSRNRVRITGWVDPDIYQQYLSAADVAVQLRGKSRGETSAAVLDTMNYAVPTIVNANGAFKELPDDCVVKIDDNFKSDELVRALVNLHKHPNLRQDIGLRAQRHIHTSHDPISCGTQYADIIERIYDHGSWDPRFVAERIPKQGLAPLELARIAATLDEIGYSNPTIFIDVTSLVVRQDDIARRRWKQIFEGLTAIDGTMRIEPVRWCDVFETFVYARRFAIETLELPVTTLHDEAVRFRPGETIVMLNPQTHDRAYWETDANKFGLDVWFAELHPQFRRSVDFSQVSSKIEEWLRILIEHGASLSRSKFWSLPLIKLQTSNPNRKSG